MKKTEAVPRHPGIRYRFRDDGSLRGYEVRYRDPEKRGKDGRLVLRARIFRTLDEAVAHRAQVFRPKLSRMARFRAWVRIPSSPDDCWLWVGHGCGKPKGRDYGKFLVAPRTNVFAHRLSYEMVHGPIPVGLTLDHLCRVTRCVNPWHLEPVTQLINTRRAAGLEPIPPIPQVPPDAVETWLAAAQITDFTDRYLERRAQRQSAA